VTASPLGRQPRWTDDSTLDNVLHLMEQVAETILLKENVKLPFDRQSARSCERAIVTGSSRRPRIRTYACTITDTWR